MAIGKEIKKFIISEFSWLTLLLVFIIGIFFGKWPAISDFEIDTKINPIEFLSIIVTVVAAYVVTTILDKGKIDTRSAKDLVLKRCESINEKLETLNSAVNTGSVEIQKITSGLKGVSSTLNTIIRSCNKINLINANQHKMKIMDDLGKLRVLLTSTPIIRMAQSNPPIVISNSVVSYSSTRINESEIVFSRIKDSLLDLELDITTS